MERGEFFVFHEPFQQAFIYRNLWKEQGQRLGLHFQTGDSDKIAQIIEDKAKKQPVFVKAMANAICPYLENHPKWLHDPSVTLFFLIRDPAQSLESHYLKALEHFPQYIEVLSDFQRFDLQHQLILKLENLNQKPVIIDAKDLLKDPFKMMQKLCRALNLPFNSRTLSWKKGMQREWAPFAVFHEETANTEGFLPFKAPLEPFKNVQPQHLEMVKKWYARSRPYYDEMHKKRLRL